MKALFDRVLAWWDMTMYALAWRSINRMCRRNPGYAYLFQLRIERWLKTHPLSDAVREATEAFERSTDKQRE